MPANYTVADVAAIQALARGDATLEMQQRALRFIIDEIARTYDEPYIPPDEHSDGRRETDLALGKAHVGRQIVKLTKLDLGKLKDKEDAARNKLLKTFKGESND